MTKEDKAVDLRLRQTYGISLEEYNEMLSKNNGGCWICGKKPTSKRLHVDHDHKIAKLKVSASKIVSHAGKWYAYVHIPSGVGFYSFGQTKSEAIRKCKEKLKKISVRGILCWQCNAAIQKFRDDPNKMEAAAKYIRNYQEVLSQKQ
jgi:hypothetical protein